MITLSLVAYGHKTKAASFRRHHVYMRCIDMIAVNLYNVDSDPLFDAQWVSKCCSIFDYKDSAKALQTSTSRRHRCTSQRGSAIRGPTHPHRFFDSLRRRHAVIVAAATRRLFRSHWVLAGSWTCCFAIRDIHTPVVIRRLN